MHGIGNLEATPLPFSSGPEIDDDHIRLSEKGIELLSIHPFDGTAKAGHHEANHQGQKNTEKHFFIISSFRESEGKPPRTSG